MTNVAKCGCARKNQTDLFADERFSAPIPPTLEIGAEHASSGLRSVLPLALPRARPIATRGARENQETQSIEHLPRGGALNPNDIQAADNHLGGRQRQLQPPLLLGGVLVWGFPRGVEIFVQMGQIEIQFELFNAKTLGDSISAIQIFSSHWSLPCNCCVV